MSSTNRGGKRRKDDLYETPPEYTDLIIPKLHHTYFSVIEPSSGNGLMVDRLIYHYPMASHLAVELSPYRAGKLRKRLAAQRTNSIDVIGTNFLKSRSVERCVDALRSPKLFITNPPYKLAKEFVERCLSFCNFKMGDEVALLLRYGFIASKKRKSFHDENPSDMGILHKRPSFTGKGTDSCEYAWFLYGHKRGGRFWLL